MASLKTIRDKIKTGESQGNKAIKLLQMAFTNLMRAQILASKHPKYGEDENVAMVISDAEFAAEELLDALRKEIGY